MTSIFKLRRRLLIGVFLIAFQLCSTTGKAAETASPRLTLDRIFTDDEFEAKEFSAKWSKETDAYTFLDPDTANKEEKAIWQRNPAKSKGTVLISSSDLTPPDEASALEIDDYFFSKDQSLVLIYTNSKRVWRKNTRGDYWLLDRSSGELRQLGGEARPSSLMFAKISPTGEHVAYVRDRNIFVEDIADRTTTQLTETPNKHIINGTSDWVYEEELSVRDGFRWSPDGNSIAYWQFDDSEVPRHTILNQVSGLYPKKTTFAYPKTGQTNSSVRMGVVNVIGGSSIWFDIPGDSRNHYLSRLEWADNNDEVIIQQLNRNQNENRVYLGNTSDGSVQRIFTETDQAWVDIHDELFWIDQGERFTWISDRDGWRHIYLISRDGTEATCITPGEFDVIKLLSVDKANRWAYFIASPDNPAQRYLYRVGLNGGNLKRLTPSRETRGTHNYNISPDGQHAFATASNFDTPPVTRLLELPSHKEIETVEPNAELKEKFDAIDRAPSDFFYVDSNDGAPLHARCLLPPDFSSDKQYPLLIHVYGEPAGQVVTDRWGGNNHLWHLMLAQQGYVVMSFDNRGTKAPRGRDWRKAAYFQVGIMAPKAQADAVQTVLKERPYLDPNRVGSWGWSGGGSMSLNAIFKFPEIYQTAIAVASVPNQRFYDTIYQERYMGHPSENIDGYREGSPINFAHQLEGNLLIIHGAADDNCHYQTFEKLVDELVKRNKPFSMMTYPRGTHSIKEGKNTSLHLYSLMTRFLNEKLPVDEPKPPLPKSP